MALYFHPDQDSGGRLRSVYEPAGGSQAIFSTRVTDYSAARPDYPPALFEALAVSCNLVPGATVADVGAGTGLLTRGFLEKGCRVIAVEPNREMREAADRLLSGMPGYRSVDGSAEAMPLEPASVDLIVAGQAFHWFDAERARMEFLRVLKPAGQVALVWNDRVPEDPLNQALDAVFTEFGGARHRVFSWPHAHRLDEATLLALVFSRSYVPERNLPAGQDVAERVRKIFREFVANGVVEMRYRTMAFVGRPA